MLAATVLLFAAAARAIQITAPANGSVWNSGEAQTISWSSVNTDPDQLTIVVQIQNPFSEKEIAKDVDTSAGSYSWTPSADLVGTDYRINFKDDKTNGILAQSGYFDVEAGSTVASSSAVASASVSASASASRSASASGAVSASYGTLSGAASSSAAAAQGSALPPNVSGSTAAGTSGASAIVPSLALVAGSLLAILA